MLSCVRCRVILVFFFKQKTAYGMRISDWSSDVCSSDLEEGKVPAGTNFAFSDGKINLPPTAAERGGIQPVVSVTAGGSARLEAKVGEMVELEVRTEVPPGAGTIIAVEWDFDGQGQYPFGHEVRDRKRVV